MPAGRRVMGTGSSVATPSLRFALMTKTASALLLALGLVCSSSPASAAPLQEAVDRGSLRLAWDGRQSGDCEEALLYLEGIHPDSAVVGEAALLQADCLLEMGRYEEALVFLAGRRGRLAEHGDELLRRGYWEWAWEATEGEDYAQALEILERARRALPQDGEVAALAEATRFRQALAEVLRGSDAGDLATGEAVSVRPEGSPPRGTGWVRAFPWSVDLPWVPRSTAREWMPGLAERLEREGRVLWVRVSGSSLRRRVGEEASRGSLRSSERQGELELSALGESVSFSAEEWAYRAAAEGQGVSGAAVSVALLAGERLRERMELLGWVEANRRELSAERTGHGALRLRHSKSGRAFVLDPRGWAEVFRARSGEWDELWADVLGELGRPARPYRCFCSRPVFLREMLVADPGQAVILEKGRGFSAVGAALCPMHQQYVTPELARSWGVGAAELAARIREDARRHPWEISFSRGEAAGRPYLLLEGEGVAALARSPELLLGALEGVDGVAVRGRTVRVLAPTPTTLVVADGSVPDDAMEAAAVRVVLGRAPSEGFWERLGFRARVRLPERSGGTFQLSLAD